jgi:glycosyltransferase involved in cell wall biosynthesis
MKVLYVNHTAEISGGERSLLDLVGALPGEISAALACPPGPLAGMGEERGLRVFPVPETVASLKLHPVHTPLGVLALVRTALGVARAARRFGPELIHANSIRAGMVTGPVARLSGTPALVHVRDCLPPGRASSLALRAVGCGATCVITNSGYTRDRLRFDAGAVSSVVVHSPVDLNRFDPARVDRADARRSLGLPESDFALGVVAQITPWKGQEEAVRITARLRERYPTVRLVLAGSTKFVSSATRFDNPAYLRRLHALCEELDVDGAVSFLGERADVPEIMRALDVALMPSWEEPFGRTVVEAMAMGTPVAATAVGGPAEIVTDGRDGQLLPPRRPDLWADAVGELLEEPERMRQMAQRGRDRARDFSLAAHVDAVLRVYRQVSSGTDP